MRPERDGGGRGGAQEAVRNSTEKFPRKLGVLGLIIMEGYARTVALLNVWAGCPWEDVFIHSANQSVQTVNEKRRLFTLHDEVTFLLLLPNKQEQSSSIHCRIIDRLPNIQLLSPGLRIAVHVTPTNNNYMSTSCQLALIRAYPCEEPCAIFGLDRKGQQNLEKTKRISNTRIPGLAGHIKESILEQMSEPLAVRLSGPVPADKRHNLGETGTWAQRYTMHHRHNIDSAIMRHLKPCRQPRHSQDLPEHVGGGLIPPSFSLSFSLSLLLQGLLLLLLQYRTTGEPPCWGATITGNQSQLFRPWKRKTKKKKKSICNARKLLAWLVPLRRRAGMQSNEH